MLLTFKKWIIVLFGLSLCLHIYVLYAANQEPVEKLPHLSQSEIIAQAEYYAEMLKVDIAQSIPIVDFESNKSLGRYIQAEVTSEDELDIINQQFAPYTAIVRMNTVHDVTIDVHIHPHTGDLIHMTANGLPLSAQPFRNETDIEPFIHEHLSSLYEFDSVSTYDFLFNMTGDAYLFSSDLPHNELKDHPLEQKLQVVIVEDKISEIRQFTSVPAAYTDTDNIQTGLLVTMIIIFSANIILILITSIQWVAARKTVSYGQPLILTSIAAIAWGLLLYFLYPGTMLILHVLQWLVMTFLTFTTLVVTTRERSHDQKQKTKHIQPPAQVSIVNGFLFGSITYALATCIYYVAGKQGAWSSGTNDFILYVNHPWYLIPIFTLSVGIAASISEEAIFRRYFYHMLHHRAKWLAILLSSFLWGVMHIGYDMHPFYLMILELTLIAGPIFYWIYWRYGFLAVVMTHFFYNSVFVSMGIIKHNPTAAYISIFVGLLPLFWAIYKLRTHFLDNNVYKQ